MSGVLNQPVNGLDSRHVSAQFAEMRETATKAKQALTRSLHHSGLFPHVRHLYRRFRGRETPTDVGFYSRFIKPGSLVFDVGANTGAKTETFLACGARVICIEPNPLCHPVIDYEFGSNPRVEVVKKAVGATETTLPINIKGLATTASMLDDWEYFGAGYSGGWEADRVDVPVTTLDKLIEQYGRPDFIKIDVEGYEPEVLRGLSSPVPCVSFEYGIAYTEQLVECIGLLRALGASSFNAVDNRAAGEHQLAFASDRPLDAFSPLDLPPGGDCFVRL